MAISATMVKDLREKTGAGMMDCKAALTETNGNIEAAIDWLRAKGLSRAAKKASRVAAEGLVAVASEGTHAVMIELNSETDFVARNPDFQHLASNIAHAALGTNGTLAAILDARLAGGATVSETIQASIATIGENISLRRAASLKVGQGSVATYIHSAIAPGLGKIGVIVGLDSVGNAEKLGQIGRQIAMHVAAAGPLAVRTSELDPTVVSREKAVFSEQARESGKPPAVIEKMVEGRMRKFYEEVVLLSQAFVVDTDKTVEQAVKDAEASAGAPIQVTEFICFRLGEGVEKGESDFAAEVAAAAGTPPTTPKH